MWILERIKISDKSKFMFLLVLAILPYPSLQFHLYRVAYYLFYFFTGYKIWQYGDSYRKNLNFKKVISLWINFVIIFIGLRMLMAYFTELSESTLLLKKTLLKVSSTSCKMVFSSFGVIAMYSTAVLFTKKHEISNWYVNIGGLCFGVYVFQEFIIKYLYYYTDLPVKVGPLVLPWITVAITLFLSVLLSKTTKSL